MHVNGRRPRNSDANEVLTETGGLGMVYLGWIGVRRSRLLKF